MIIVLQENTFRISVFLLENVMFMFMCELPSEIDLFLSESFIFVLVCDKTSQFDSCTMPLSSVWLYAIAFAITDI